MKVARFDAYPVRVPYRQNEQSSVVNTAGVSAVVVRIETDDGLVGWGECDTAADTASVEAAVRSAVPFVLGSDPWRSEQVFDRVLVEGRWRYQAMTASLAFAGIDMALLDLCGKAAGQPIHRLLGGARRDEVDYFYYLAWGTADEVAAQCREGVERGYSVFYLKVGKDRAHEETMLEAVRSTIGPERRLRIDANQSWTLPEAERILNDWHARFDIDFAEAPVPIEPVESMQILAGRTKTTLCVNEGLWGEAEALRLILARSAPISASVPSTSARCGAFSRSAAPPIAWARWSASTPGASWASPPRPDSTRCWRPPPPASATSRRRNISPTTSSARRSRSPPARAGG